VALVFERNLPLGPQPNKKIQVNRSKCPWLICRTPKQDVHTCTCTLHSKNCLREHKKLLEIKVASKVFCEANKLTLRHVRCRWRKWDNFEIEWRIVNFWREKKTSGGHFEKHRLTENRNQLPELKKVLCSQLYKPEPVTYMYIPRTLEHLSRSRWWLHLSTNPISGVSTPGLWN
jgi:hypothetical protein